MVPLGPYPAGRSGARQRRSRERRERRCRLRLDGDLHRHLRRLRPDDNRIVDVEGFANWGNPGSTVDYDDVGFVGGALMGKKFDIGDIPFRIEIDGTFGHLSAKTNKLDPEGLDETAETEFRWNATARGGIEQAVGPATVFVTGGLSAARITNSATDIDFGADMPPRLDADDSFRDG